MGQSWGQPKTFKVVLLGLEDSGKTTLLYQLLHGKKIITQSTVGSNCETVGIEGAELQIWDLGGRPNQRDAWQAYF
jgi:small GTP-binding protein